MESTTTLATVKQEVRLREWAAQVEAQQPSGLTVQQWCTENGIKLKTYYYRLKKVREQFLDSTPVIVPLHVPQQSSDICMTVCDGEIIYKDGEALFIDEEETIAKASESFEKVLESL